MSTNGVEYYIIIHDIQHNGLLRSTKGEFLDEQPQIILLVLWCNKVFSATPPSPTVFFFYSLTTAHSAMNIFHIVCIHRL